MKVYRFIVCIIISLFLFSPCFYVYADYDLGDYDYTPVAKPDINQYPKSVDGFGAFCRDFSLYYEPTILSSGDGTDDNLRRIKRFCFVQTDELRSTFDTRRKIAHQSVKRATDQQQRKPYINRRRS